MTAKNSEHMEKLMQESKQITTYQYGNF